MKLSARTRYAVRILLELAKNDEGQPTSASLLADLTGVSIQFVEQIVKELKQKGFTASVRGAAGGHKLAKHSKEIRLGDIVHLMEGEIVFANCCKEKEAPCPREPHCLLQGAWKRVSWVLQQELASISLASLLAENSFSSCGVEALGRCTSHSSMQSATPLRTSGRFSGMLWRMPSRSFLRRKRKNIRHTAR